MWLTLPQCGQIVSTDGISMTTRCTSSGGTMAPLSLQRYSVVSPMISTRHPQRSAPNSSWGMILRGLGDYSAQSAVAGVGIKRATPICIWPSSGMMTVHISS